MIPYAFALLLLGLPIAWAEWAMGRYGGARDSLRVGDLPDNLEEPGIGVLRVLATLIPVGNLHVLRLHRGLVPGLFHRYLAGAMDFGPDPARYQSFFDNFVGKMADGSALSTPGEGILGSASSSL